MSIIAQAEQLKAQIEAALGDLVDLVTLDGSGVKPQTRAAVVIRPPRLEFPNYGERDTSFTILVIAGPADRQLRALSTIDQIMTVLEDEQFPLKTAQPAAFGLANAGSLPAYEITLYPL